MLLLTGITAVYKLSNAAGVLLPKIGSNRKRKIGCIITGRNTEGVRRGVNESGVTTEQLDGKESSGNKREGGDQDTVRTESVLCGSALRVAVSVRPASHAACV